MKEKEYELMLSVYNSNLNETIDLFNKIKTIIRQSNYPCQLEIHERNYSGADVHFNSKF